MAMYELKKDGIIPVDRTSFSSENLLEREDLQRLLRDNIDVVAPSTLIISEEFSRWQDSSRRIDLLGIDKNANLVVIELKRTEDGGHMELQAIRYAAMVSKMTFEYAVQTFSEYLQKRKIEEDAKGKLLNFLNWTEPQEEDFAKDIRIILVSADFSQEVATTVMWLNERDLDINCMRLVPYKLNGQILLDVQQLIPLPEAFEYQIRLRQKEQAERVQGGRNWDEPSFLQELESNKGLDNKEVAKDIIEWSHDWSEKEFWGHGKTSGSFIPSIESSSKKYYFFAIWTYGSV